MTNAKKSLIYKIISVLMVIAMFMMTGCGPVDDDSSSGGTSGSESDSQSTKPEGYSYGEDWLDVYDAEYTEKLLKMGEQYFTVSQLSSAFEGG